MKFDQKAANNSTHQSASWWARIPSCLWFLLGGGTVILLAGLALLLAWLPGIRNTSGQEEPLVETPASSLTPPPPDHTTTPYSSPDSPTRSPATPTPPTGKDYLESGSDPAILLLVTPSSSAGNLTITPYLTADAGNFLLESGGTVIFRWQNYPPGALRYHFALQPHAGESYLTIGIDDDPADGVEVSWLVPENIAGDLHAFAIFESGQVSAVEFAGAIYSKSSSGSSAAENVLKEYFRTLSAGEYRAAADLYGGDYSVLQQNNPDLSPEDRAGLFQRACQQNGFVCLPVNEILAVKSAGEGQFQITVTFQDKGGIPFQMEGCCGDPETANTQTEFTFRVGKDPQGHFLVMDLPVYVP